MISDQEKEDKLMQNKAYTAKYLKMIIKEKASIFKGYSTMKKPELINIIVNNRIHFKVLHKALEKESLNSENIKKTPKTTKPKTTTPPNKSKAITALKNNIKELKKELKQTKEKEEKEAIKEELTDQQDELKELLE